MKPGHGRLYGLIALMICFWSANFIVGKVALRSFPPLLLAGLRVTLAGLFVWPLYCWQGRRKSDRWEREDLPALIWLGLFGVALNQLLFVTGLSRTSVGHSAFIMGMTPILVLLIAASMKLERITARKVIGMCVALAGVAILKAFEHKDSGPTWFGDAATFLSALSFALFTVFGKRATLRHKSITVNAFAYIGGAVALSPVTLWQSWRFPFAQVATSGWASLVYMALFPSVLAYLIYYHALEFIPASRVSAFSYLQPLLATSMAVALLDEVVTLPLVAGGAVIFSGVYLAERG